MELIGVKENPIKIKRTIFNMDPKIEKTMKISRNVDSGLTQLQQITTLLHTLLRLEAIRQNAYERWQPFFNEGQLDFLGLLAYLNVFHSDQKIIQRLDRYFKTRQATLMRLKKNKDNIKLVERLHDSKIKGLELMEELRSKIYSLQLTADQFQTMTVR